MKIALSRALPAFLPLLVAVAVSVRIPHPEKANNIVDGYANVTKAALDVGKRDPFDERQNPGALRGLLYAAIGFAVEFGHDQGYSRSEFTQNMISTLYNANPHYNYVICCVDHWYEFDGIKGSDWGHQEVSWIHILEHKYDVVIGGAGEFIRIGNGGFINWAYAGNVTNRRDKSGATIIDFGSAPSS